MPTLKQNSSATLKTFIYERLLIAELKQLPKNLGLSAHKCAIHLGMPELMTADTVEKLANVLSVPPSVLILQYNCGGDKISINTAKKLGVKLTEA